MKFSAKELAEAMASEGLSPELIKKVLLNLGFSVDEAVRSIARVCIILNRNQEEARDDKEVVIEEISAPPRKEDLRALERRLSILETRVSAIIDLLSDYVPVMIEKIRAKEAVP